MFFVCFFYLFGLVGLFVLLCFVWLFCSVWLARHVSLLYFLFNFVGVCSLFNLIGLFVFFHYYCYYVCFFSCLECLFVILECLVCLVCVLYRLTSLLFSFILFGCQPRLLVGLQCADDWHPNRCCQSHGG